MEDNIQSVYNKLVSYGYEGTEDDFRNYISDDANIPSVYDKFVSKGYQGTEDDFRGYLGITSQQPAQRVDVSDVEQSDQPFVPTMEPQGMQPVEEPIADEAGADGRFKPSWGWERSQRQDAGQAANAGDDNMMRMHRAGKPDWSGYQQQQYEQMAGQVNAKYGIPTQLSTENYDSVSQRLANLDKEYDRIAERQSIFVDDDIEPSWVARDNARLASLNEERDALRAYKTAFGATDERQSYEQRVGSVFDEIDNEGVAERAWDNAEKRTAEAQSGEPYNVAGIFNMGVEKLKYHDLQRMADEAWNMLGAEKQQEITGKLYDVLKEYYPDADEQSLREGAEKMARQQSNQRVFDVAVENNAPKSALDQFFRRAVGMNSVIRIVEGMERMAAGTTGDMEAREVAEQNANHGWNKAAGIAGTVLGMGLDPTVWMSGGASGAATKGLLGGLERKYGAALAREFTNSLTGRVTAGALGGAVNLGTYEAANEAIDQFRWGGEILGTDPETGRYNIGDFNPGKVAGKFGRGFLLGTSIGVIAPTIGNVSDKLVNATESTLGKVGLRAGELAAGTVAEGTVFAVPEFVSIYSQYGDMIASLSDENSPNYIADPEERAAAMEKLVGERKGAMLDAWTDSMATMAGFKGHSLMKSAPQRIAELRGEPNGKAGFETRLRSMLDGRGGLGLTEDEKLELNRSGYGDLNNLVDEYQDYVKSRKNQTVRPDRMLQDGGGEPGDIPYNRFEQLMTDQNVSESARAKMYYYITGNVLPMSTVTGSTFTEVRDPNGNLVGYQVQSMGNNGVITSKTFKSEKAARAEENKILRQVELNAIDGGERWFDSKNQRRIENEPTLIGERKTSADVRQDLFNKYFVDIDKAVKKEPTRRSKVEQQAVDEYINTLWRDVIKEQETEQRQHQETKAEMLRLKAASEGLAEDLMTEDDPTTLKSAGRDMRDARRALSDKIGEERMQALENMDEDQLATAYSEADADTQTLMKKWLISSDQDAVAEGLSQRSVSAVGQFKESIVSFFENNAASGDAQRSKLSDGMLTLVDVDGSPYIVVGTHGRMYTVKDVNGNARMVDASQCKNERDVSLDQFVLEQTAPELDRYAALAEAFNGTDYTPGQVAVVGEGGRGKQVMVLGVDGENVTYADGYTVGKDGQVQVVAERTVPKQQFRDMVEQWEKKAEQDAKRQASLTNVPVSQMEAGMRFPVEWRGEIMTAEVVEEGGKKSVNIVGQDGSVVERGIDDFTDEDWQAIRTVAPEPASDVVAEAKKSNIGVGDEVSYNGEVGGALSGTVVEVRDNGLVTFETPDGDRYTKWRSLLKVEKPAVDETPADVKPEQENKPVEIPRTESGDIAHSLLDVNDKETYDAAVREEVENALAFAKDGDAAYVENNLVAAQAAVEEAEKKVPTAQGAAQRRAELETIGNERAAARNLVDFWKEVSKEKSKKVWEDLQNPKEVSNFAADPEKQQEWVDSHYDDIINGYVATYGNKLDPDELRKALKPIGYDGSNVEEFRDQEIRLRDDLYGRMLKAAVDSGNPSITILTGVGGAGKSTATQNMDLSGRGLVFDAALNKPKKLAAAIKKAKDAGMKDIQVVAVKNDAPTAFENTLRRGLSEGRFLPLEYFTKSYQDNQGKIAEIRERYPDVEIVSYDNSGNNGRGVTIDEASNWDYTIDDETLSKLLDIYENGIDQGRFTADQAAAIGRGLSEITWSRGSRAAELDRRISRIERRIRQAGDGLLRSEVSAQRSGSGRRDLGSSSMGDEGDGGSNPRPAGQGSGAEGTGYVARFDQLDRDAAAARLSGDTESLSRINSDKAKTVQEYLDSIKTDDAYVLTADNYESVLKANEVKEEDIQQVRDMYEYTRREHKRMGGFNIDGKIYVFADDVRSIDDARSTYVHERQHNINDKDVNLLPEVEATAGRDELLSYVQALSGTHAYDNMTHKRLADEFLSMAMEVAYRTDDVETALREMGIENDELINIIKRLDDEQRTSDSLANARRNTYVDNNGQGSGRPDGTDQGRRPAEVGGQGLRPDEGGRQETEGVRVSDEGVTSISDAAEKEGSGIEVGGDTRFNIATEPQLQRQIKDYVKTRDAQNAGWTDEKVSAVVAETEDLIKAIDNALSGEKFYKEWSGRMPTVKVDWRDGEEKPTVTWTRGNIDYKYDMSADLLCINNEGMEDVLSSPTMVDLMLAMQKGKKGFTSDDYMTLYNTLDDLGFVVPCKGCFDAAARFKMLPSTSQKFVDLVNETIDRRNKDKEAFDNMLRARAAKSGSALPNGLPSSAKNKEEAVEIGVAGDDLTEHITWTQLMSAEGQTKALYDWGGVFRAWQRTGAGRPKDKLLPEPYSGDIMSPFATIVAPYGEKTPSFREYEVNVGTGLRRNSHSEFRPILAVDEIQFMRDAYLRNLMVFKYMKELDDVRLFGKMGVKFNMSFFPAFVEGTPAAGLDKDGNYIASEESVGSREFEYVGEDGRKHYDGMKGFQEAQKYVNDNVSLSSVVFSVPHLIKAFTDVPTPTDKSGVWGSLIPFHNSGAVKSQIKKQGLGDERAASPKDKFEVEAMIDYDKGVTNFEQVQNDRFGEGWVIVEGKKKGTAVEPGHKLEFANGTHYYNERLGLHLFGSFYIYDNEIPSDMDLTDGNYSKADLKKLGHEYSIDYNDKVRELNSDYGYKEAVDEYVDFMRSIGLVPRFDFTVPEATFLEMCERAKVDPRHPKLGWKGEGNGWSPADAESYYSLWCDYGMTDPATGKWSPHRPVGYIDENGERSFRMPDNTVDIVREGVARYSERKRAEEGRVNEAITEFTRRSVDAGKISEKDAERILGDAGIDFGAEQDIDGNEGVRFRVVDDPKEIERLENEPKVYTYRAMALVGGNLYPPMSSKIEGAYREPSRLGEWERADETGIEFTDEQLEAMKRLDNTPGRGDVVIVPGKVRYHKESKGVYDPKTGKGGGTLQYHLVKDNGKDLWAAYNPYFHSSPVALNDQFSEAQDRPNIVTVRMEIPQSEANGESGYHAEYAADAVGHKPWKAGPIQGKVTGKRDVIMSRWAKPVEIVPNEEVARNIMEHLNGEVTVMPTNVVTPDLRKELEKMGMRFIETDNRGKIVDGEYAGQTWASVWDKVGEDMLPDGDESQAIYDKAKEIFGTTSDINEAGYILPDGDMLDFSGRNSLDKGVDDSFLRGRRTADHRDIANVNYEKDGNTPSGLKTDMPDFIRRGAIRIDSNAGVINLSVKPTKQQRWPIRRIVEANDGDVQVDFGDGWDSDHYVEYEGAKPSRVLADIDRYFDEGIKPEGNVRFRVTDQQDADYMDAVNRGDMETAQRMVNEAAKAAMPNTKVVDENGNPLVVYHGTASDFNIFGIEHLGETSGNKGWFGSGFYFTQWKESARGYAGWAKTKNGGEERIIPCFINIKNPQVVDATQGNFVLDKNADGVIATIDIPKDNPYSRNGQRYSNGEFYYEVKANNPNQIKSADPVTYDDQGNVIPLSERFNEGNDDIRFRVTDDEEIPIFVSNAARAVESIKQEKATPEQWLKMIEKGGGLKAGEDKWIGLSDWLKEQKGSLTKKDVLDFIKENAIRIEEVRYSDDTSVGKNILESNPQAQERFNEMQDEYKRILADEKEKNGDTWVAYVKASDRLDEKYPNSSVAYDTDDGGNLKVKLGMEKKALEALGLEADNPINATRLNYTTEGLDNKKEIALVVPTVESWNSGDDVHFGDAGEGRAVAWIRFGDTTDEDGNKVLVIDEIQSKRHQDARENGYKTTVDEADKDFYDFIARTKEKYHYTSTTPLKSVFTDEEMKEYNRLNRRLSDAYNNEGIPEAPFEKNWHELAMKRMLRYAAENGYDKVAWTKGEQQAERYDLGEKISSIDVSNLEDGTKLVTLNFRNRAEQYEDLYQFSVNSDGRILKGDFAGKELSDVVGKDMSKKIMGVDQPSVSFSGDDLRVGTEGMKGFYDRMLPSFMDKYGKKWGVKTQEVTLPNLENAARKMWAVDVTDQMKDDVMDGQVMFSIIGEKGSANDETAMANLEVAKQMEKEGKDAKTMWLATGWEKGTDGKWRREIPDLKPKDIDPKTAKTVGELVDAPELFEAYPQLKDIKVSFKKLKGMGGKYTDSDNSITLNPDYTTDFIVPEEFDDIARQKMHDWYMGAGIPTRSELNSQYRKIKKSLGRRTMTELGKEILEHELQHAIQHIEGFATGGTSTAMSKDYVDNEYNGDPGLLTFAKYWSSGNSAPRLMAYGKQRMAEAVRKNINVISAEERQAALEMADMFEVMSDADYNAFVRDARDLWSKIKKEGKEGYRNLAGEVEARNAQKRGVMTEEERRSTPPSETEDTPRNKQIVRGVGEGVGFGSEGSEIDEAEPIDEKYDAGMLSRREMLAETLLDMAQRNKDDNQAKMDAIRAVARALNETMKTSDNPNFDIAMQDRSVASAQRTYDKATVDGIVRLARLMSKSDLFKDFSRGEVNRLLTLVKNAAGRKDISQQANKVADMMLQHAVKEMDGILKKQLNVKGAKTNAQGVMEQGRLDLQGQRMVDAMKRGMELDDASLQELIDEANDGMGSDNESKAANAAVDYQGYMLAKQYIDDIKASKAEEDRMRDDIRKKEQEVKDGELDRKAYNEFVNETERAIRENKVQRVNAYGRLLTSVGQDIKDSFGRAKAFRDAQIEHVNDIHHNANSDLEGMPSSEHSTADNKLINSSAARFLLRPVADFDEMLRFLGRKSVDGKGYLFNRFMPAFTKASDTEHKNKYADHQELDAKVSDVFGRKMRWSDLFAVEGSLPTINVRFRDGGEMKDHELTQGKALYVYMVNKMTDGRMKLRAMGITDDDVQAIKDQLDPRFVELADWVQGEFLPKLRERYNEVHTRMFGAPMDAIEDYFRLEINDRSRGREMDISAPESDMRPSTVTGSIKKRVKNSTALDLTNTDAFDMLLGNIDEMEHWAAFAELNRDINILLSYNKFRNRVMNMTSARFGSGETLWNNFVDTARIVAGVYQPKVRAKDLDNALVNMSKGVTAAKISFRLYTALKQLLSYPAYLSEASPVELVKSSNPVGAVKAWNWAMENLPGFAKRWQSRQAGDTRLKETDVDWQLWKNKIIETAGRLGMTPNAFVDAMTVAMGSKAVYETALKRYMNDGYSKEAAEEKAKMDASLAYNETQQSSEAAYISGMQLDRTLASVALTVFRNASMAYQRRFMRSLANMKKMMRKGFREENMEYAKKQMMRDGLSEEQAEEAAKRSYRRAWAKNAADLAIFGWVLQFAWNLGSYLMYLLFGKDDDMKDEMLKDAALHAVAGGVEGMSGGSIMSEYYNTMRKRKEYEDKYGKAPAGQSSGINFTTLPIMSDIKTTLQHFDQDDVRGINDIVNLVIQAGVGVNPQTITDAVVAIVDATNGDMETGKEIGMLLMRLAQVPQSQVDNIYIDELGMTAKDAKNMDVDAMAKRYARYKNRRDTFFTGWMYDEGEREKAEDRYAKRFDKKIQERIQAMDDDELTDALEEANPEMKQKFNKEYASRQGISYTKSSTEYGAVYDQLVTPKDISEDAVLRQAKKDAKETGDDRLYKEIDSFQRQLTNIKKGASYHIGEVKVKDEDSPGLGKGEKTDESVMRNIRKQRELFMRRHGLTQ